jgi:murein DD-endopeptidase MepM/ murein hydrolase activator NlpD
MPGRPPTRRFLFAVVALLGLAAPAAAPSAAQAPSTVPAAPTLPADTGFHLEDGSPELDQLLKLIDQAKTRRRQLDAQAAELNRKLRAIEKEVAEAEARVVAIQAQERDLQRRLDETRLQVAAAKEELRKRAVAAYINGPTASNQYVDLLLHVRDVRELASSSGYVTAVLDAQSKALARHLALSREVEHLHDRLAAARDEALRQRDAVTTRKRLLDATRQSTTRLSQQLSSVIDHQGQLAGKVFESRDQFLSELRAFQEQSSALATLLRYRQSGQEAAAPGPGVLSLPIRDAPIVSAFGPRVHPIFGDVRMHEGIDLGAAAGTPITAAGDGVVVSAGPMGGYGNATLIDHGSALATLYAHQSVVVVQAGDPVTKGQLIGAVGCTGLCTGAHLHFEVRVNGTPVDPFGWL